MPIAVPGDNSQWSAGVAVNFNVNRPAEPDLFAFKSCAHFPVQCRIVRLPNTLARPHPPPVDIVAAKTQHGLSVFPGLDLIDPAAFLALIRFPRIEDDAIARL